VRHRLGQPQPFVPEGTALGEAAQLGMTLSESGPAVHGGQVDLTEALAALRPLEGRHGLPVTSDGPPMVALGPVSQTKALVRQCVQDHIPTRRGEHQGALGGGHGLIIRAHEVEMA
jgi:hypothetical protein